MLRYNKTLDELTYHQGNVSYSKKYAENLQVDYDVENKFVGFKVFNVSKIIDDGYEFLNKPSKLKWEEGMTLEEFLRANPPAKEYNPGVYFIAIRGEKKFWNRLILHWENKPDYETGAYPWSESQITFSHNVEDDSIIGVEIWRIEDFIGYERKD